MKTAWIGLGAITLIALGCAPRLSGQLQDPVGKPVAVSEARVNVTNLQTGEMRRSLVLSVDSQGKFATSEDLGDGPFLVEALVPGYLVTSQKVDRLDAAKLSLTLKPINAPETKAVGVNEDSEVGRASGGATIMPPNL